MEKFLKDYVKMMAEEKAAKLSKDEIKTIVNNLMDEDEIWDVLDSYVNAEIEEIM